MTDKVQKIREEVVRLKSQLLRCACSLQIAMETGCKEEAYNEVLTILDTVQEEPVSGNIDFEQELYKAFGQVKDFTLGMRIAKWFYDMGKNSKESISEDLDAEVEHYIRIGGYDGLDSEMEVKKIANHFANWQKEQEYTCYEEAFEDGASWKKEQMMANAIETTVHIDAGGYPYIPQIELYDYDKDVPLAKEGDKYKVILIKED